MGPLFARLFEAGRFALLAILLGVTLAGCGVNNIPTQEETAKAKWSQVLNQYQRRADLIPNLVETVKGYAKQEAQVLEAVVAARARATSVQVPADIADQSGGVQEIPGSAVAALRRARPAAGDQRELSGPEVEPELPRAAVAARRHREPHRGRAARLHRGGAGLQHRAQDVSRRDLGEHALQGQQADGDVHHRRRDQAPAAGQVLAGALAGTTSCDRLLAIVALLCASLAPAAALDFPRLDGRRGR